MGDKLPLRLATHVQKARHNDDSVMDDEQNEAETKKGKKTPGGHVNELSEADFSKFTSFTNQLTSRFQDDDTVNRDLGLSSLHHRFHLF
ncbi:Serine/threonine-protein kinase Tel1 [Fusarium sp. LHS14.1]|nr:Serine/threonine-protein kinase Tel1 [Fusarium sp. LHS14.1]